MKKCQTKYGRRSAVPIRGIRDAAATIANAMIANTWNEFIRKLDCIRDHGDRHVEVY